MNLQKAIPDAFLPWHELATELGFVDFLSAEDGFRSSLSSGDRWRGSKECGVYFWIAEDGETYVGETLSARDRLLEHWRNHPDLRFACFQSVAPNERKAREEELIRRVGSKFPTRNIKHAFNTRAFVPFDQFISPPERDAFLVSEIIEEDGDVWQHLPISEQKQARRYQKFAKLPNKDLVLEGLLFFVWSVIPRPRLLENRFWSVSLFPGSNILRVNAGQQEIFTVSRADAGDLIVRALTLRPSGPDPDGPYYKTSSYVDWFRLEELPEWLQESDRLLSSRELAIQLMRHTTALNNGSHCPQVLRAAWKWFEDNLQHDRSWPQPVRPTPSEEHDTQNDRPLV